MALEYKQGLKPVQFEEQTTVLGKPPSMSDEECASLPVYTDGHTCISCWELTDEQIEILLKTKKLWVGVIGGQTQPPIWLDVDNPFNTP